jgi:hypothetical protein
MSTPRTAAQKIGPWLKANGMNLGALTGQDFAALKASAEIMDCYARCDGEAEAHLLMAFAHVAYCMQPGTRYLAYHGIAMALDWHCRTEIWERARIEPIVCMPRCSGEPRQIPQEAHT